MQLVGLKKKFGQMTVLNNIDLNIKEAEILYILGSSGAGKSVLLKHLIGLMQPDDGEIYFDSVSLIKLDKDRWHQIRQKMGVLFQTASLFDFMDVYSNVAFALHRLTDKNEEEIRDIVAHKLQLVGLMNVAHKFPTELSLGVKKRVALARAIAIGPSVVFYDEPTTSIDPISITSINQLISDLNQKLGVTTMVISHDIQSTLNTAHRIAFLHNGEIIFLDTPDKFVNSSDKRILEFVGNRL